MKRLLPLLLTGCLSASAAHGSFNVKSTVPSIDVGNDKTPSTIKPILVSNMQRVVITHCAYIGDCFDQTEAMCGKNNGFTLHREEWVMTTHMSRGIYFVLAECK